MDADDDWGPYPDDYDGMSFVITGGAAGEDAEVWWHVESESGRQHMMYQGPYRSRVDARSDIQRFVESLRHASVRDEREAG